MQALIVEPMKPPYVKEIGEELEDLQHEVGGYIEAIYPFEDEVAIICNEEGKLDGLQLNRALRTDQGEIYDIIAGTFMVVGLTEESFGSLTPKQIAKYTELYKVPEVFLMRDGRITAIPVAPTIYEPVQKSEYEEVRNGIRLVVRRDEDPIDPRRINDVRPQRMQSAFRNSITGSSGKAIRTGCEQQICSTRLTGVIAVTIQMCEGTT